MSCEKEQDWSPTSDKDSQAWQEHVDCYFHLGNIVASPFTSSDLLIEIIKGANFRDYFSFRERLWENPNLDENILGWLDRETAKWPVDEAIQYWQTRVFLKDGDLSPVKSLRTGTPIKISFNPAIYSEELESDESATELIRICQPFSQQLWHDLATADTAYLQYQEDSVSGSTFRAYMPDTTLDVPEMVLDSLSDGYFTDWISKEIEIDESYAFSEILSRIEEDGFKEWEDSVQDQSLCKALVYGAEVGDLEITLGMRLCGNLQKYLVESGLFGESDFDYPVKIEGKPRWEGIQFRELKSGQQLMLAKNIRKAMSHSLLGRDRGIARHLLVCIVLHPSTSPDVWKYLEAENLGAEVAAAIEYATAN